VSPAPVVALLASVALLAVVRCVRVASVRPAAGALVVLALADVARLFTVGPLAAPYLRRLDVVLSMLWPVAAVWLVNSRAAPKDQGRPESPAPQNMRDSKGEAAPWESGDGVQADRHRPGFVSWHPALTALYRAALPLAILAYAVTLALVGHRLAAHWTLALQAPRLLVGAVAAYVGVRARVRREWPGWSVAIGCVIGLGQVLALSAWGEWETTVRAMSLLCWAMVGALVALAR